MCCQRSRYAAYPWGYEKTSTSGGHSLRRFRSQAFNLPMGSDEQESELILTAVTATIYVTKSLSKKNPLPGVSGVNCASRWHSNPSGRVWHNPESVLACVFVDHYARFNSMRVLMTWFAGFLHAAGKHSP